MIVTVSQRPNSFGYLAFSQSTAERVSSANYCFMDQVMALDWIYDNIEAFGGDPEKIAIGGQSIDIGKWCNYAASPTAKGKVSGIVAYNGLRWGQIDELILEYTSRFYITDK